MNISNYLSRKIEAQKKSLENLKRNRKELDQQILGAQLAIWKEERRVIEQELDERIAVRQLGTNWVAVDTSKEGAKVATAFDRKTLIAKLSQI